MIRVLQRVGWIGLTLVTAFLLYVVVKDVHESTMLPPDVAQGSGASAARPVISLETGYALHELAFTAVFLAVVVMPLRRRQVWAWWIAWIVLIANLAYMVYIARRGSPLLSRGIVFEVAAPALLVMCAPAMFTRRAGVRT